MLRLAILLLVVFILSACQTASVEDTQPKLAPGEPIALVKQYLANELVLYNELVEVSSKSV